VTSRPLTPGDIHITVHHSDALVLPMRLPRPAIGPIVDSHAVGVGFTDAGRWWRLPVFGQHILIAGATGSGKGSVVWSLIAAVAPAIRAGWVRLWVIDPKGGMEFGRGAALFTGFAYDNASTPVGCSARPSRSCRNGRCGCVVAPGCTPQLVTEAADRSGRSTNSRP